MLTRVLFALTLICGMATASYAEDAKVLALGRRRPCGNAGGARKGRGAPGAAFNTPAVAYVLAGDLMKGDTVEVGLFNDDRSLMRNTETAGEDQAKVLAASRQARRACRRLAGRKL